MASILRRTFFPEQKIHIFSLDNSSSLCYNIIIISEMHIIDMVDSYRIAAYTRISVDAEPDKDNTSIGNRIASAMML